MRSSTPTATGPRWERDWQNRVTREVRANGTTDTLYTYDATGRLKTVTDPKDQVTTHTYATDDSLLTTVYTNATILTPGVTYTYDPVYPRVSTMVDGIGTTSLCLQGRRASSAPDRSRVWTAR